MSTAAREYVNFEAIDDDYADYILIKSIKSHIKAVFGDKVGYSIEKFATLQDIEDSLCDYNHVLEASEGKLPIILINVTYQTEDFGPEDFAKLEARLPLRFYGEATEKF